MIRRYNDKKRGSFQTDLSFYDWELSITIGAIRRTREAYLNNGGDNKGYLTYLSKLEQKFSKALGDVLKAEFTDLKEAKKEQGDVM